MEEENPALSVISKGAVIILAGILISKLLTYLFRVVIARSSLGAEGYGIFSLVAALFGIATIIPILGLNQGLLRYVPYYLTKKDNKRVGSNINTALKVSFVLSILTSIIIFLSAEWIAMNIFKEEELIILLKILAIAIPFEVIKNIIIFILKGFKKAKYETYIKNIAEGVIKLGLSIILIKLGFSIVGVVIAYISASIISFIISVISIKKEYPSFAKSLIRSPIETKLLKFSLPLMFTAALTYLIYWTDTLMIGWLLKRPDLVGVYNVATPTALLLYTFSYAIFVLLIPLLTEAYTRKDLKGFDEIYKYSTKWAMITIIFLAILFIIYPGVVLNLFFGSEYVIGSTVLVILSVGCAINFILKGSENVLLVLKKTKILFWNTLIIALLNIILNYFLIQKYGINGSALATSIAYGLLGIIFLVESYILTKMSPLKWSYIKIPIAAFISLISLKLFTTPNKTIYILGMFLLSGLIYLALLFIFKVFSKEDKNMYEMIKEKIKDLSS